jgi:uncharacterized protein (DUF1015 family)
MQVKPFKAFRFNEAVVGDVGSCIAPPYDVISPSQQQQLHEKSKYNIVRIIKGNTSACDHENDNPYTRAADYFNSWIIEGALRQDLAETIYGYIQDFNLAGSQFQRLSFIALARLEEFGRTVRPHEAIMNGPMLDRLNLKKATAARFGLVFMLYEDEQRVADKIIENIGAQEPLIDVVNDQDVRHRLFAITAKEDIDAIVKMMSDKTCIIADGHHRYTTGLTYSKQSSNPAAQYQMLAFANTCQQGLRILATHRLVGNLANFNIERLVTKLRDNFEVTKFKFNSRAAKTMAKHEMVAQMRAEHDKGKNAFGIYSGTDAFYVAALKDHGLMDAVVPDKSPAYRALDVSVLHKLILEKLLGIDEQKLAKGENVEYVKDVPTAIDDSISQVDAGEKQAVFFMNPVKMEQLKMVTDAGERMPQKSTYFYPKMYTGLTIQKL